MRSEEVARASAKALEEGDLDAVGRLMTEQWELKSSRLPHIATPRFERLRAAAMEAGRGRRDDDGRRRRRLPAGLRARPRARCATAMEGVGAPELTFDVDEQGAIAE